MNIELIALVADDTMSKMIAGLLGRLPDVGCKPVSHEIVVHPNKDPGCRRTSSSLLRGYLHKADRALVVFDYEGCGDSRHSPEDVRISVLENLSVNGWENRCEVIVINPELEVWIWIGWQRIAEIIRWPHGETLEAWLAKDFPVLPDCAKPKRPKEAFQAALRGCQLSRSSSLYAKISMAAPLDKCTDPSFLLLKATLRGWFPT
jgi:hypothetical protein